MLVAAANPDMMEEYIEDNDLVIIGNRYESQLCALEMNAGAWWYVPDPKSQKRSRNWRKKETVCLSARLMIIYGGTSH